jgi:hypothetical protein
MAISSTPLNSDGIDAQSALQRKTPIPGVRGARAGSGSGEVSYVSNISPSGFAMLALDNFKTSAEAFKNSGAYRTVRYLQVMAQSVVGSLNGLRDILSQASALRNKYSTGIKQALDSINGVLDSGAVNLSALAKVGVQKDADGRFSVNANQVVKAFNEDGANAFATISDFAYDVSKAPDPPEKILGQSTDTASSQEAASGDGTNDVVNVNVDLQQRLRDAFAAAIGSFTARKAVSLYETVESI